MSVHVAQLASQGVGHNVLHGAWLVCSLAKNPLCIVDWKSYAIRIVLIVLIVHGAPYCTYMHIHGAP